MTVGQFRRLQELAAGLCEGWRTFASDEEANLAAQPSECELTFCHFERTWFCRPPRQLQESYGASASQRQGSGYCIVVQPATDAGSGTFGLQPARAAGKHRADGI